jgi:hypothetical protein
MQILNAFVPLEIRRRRWLIRKLVKRMDKISTEAGAEWLIKNERKVTHAVENLLELSSYAIFSCLSSTYSLTMVCLQGELQIRLSNYSYHSGQFH